MWHEPVEGGDLRVVGACEGEGVCVWCVEDGEREDCVGEGCGRGYEGAVELVEDCVAFLCVY